MKTPEVHQASSLRAFSCLGSDCPDTCCHGWSMQVDPVRLAAYARDPRLAEGAVASTPSGPVMRRDEATQLCLQLRGGLCAIQAEHGSDGLTDACHFYPRIVRAVGGDVQVSAVLSCPETARIALYGAAPHGLVPGEAGRLPITLNAYAGELSGEAARGALDATLDLVRQAGDAGRALVRLQAMAASRPAYAWPRRRVSLSRDPLPEPSFTPADVQRVYQVFAALLHAADSFPGPRLARLVKDMGARLKVRLDPRTLDIYGGPDAVGAARAAENLWPGLAVRLRIPLRRWLEAQLLASSFPWAGLGELPLDKVHVLGLKLAILRLGLVASLPAGDPTPEEVVRITQTVSRALDHLSDGLMIVNLMRQMGWLDPPRFRGLVGDVDLE